MRKYKRTSMKKLLVILLVAFANFSFGKTEINVADYGVKGDGSDSTAAVQKVLAAAKSAGGDVVIKFPKGRYDFAPNYAPEEYLFISNNDEGLKRIVFNLNGYENITIDGQGSDFIFHGFVNPFSVKNSKNINFKNFSVDVFRPFHNEGIVLESSPGSIVVEIPEEYPFEVQEGILKFIGKPDPLLWDDPKKVDIPYRSLLEFDTKRRETAYLARDYWLNKGCPAEKLDGRKVRIRHSLAKFTPGNTVVFQYQYRNHPTFAVSKSENVNFDNVTIYGAGGMGILGQNSRDIRVRNCKVTPSGNRMISCTADATHFVNCEGEIVLDSNLFENQMDDATNIHGIYEQIVSIDGDTAVTRLVHPQQHGFETFEAGQKVEFVGGRSMKTLAEGKITSVERINNELKRLKFAEPVSDSVKPNDAIAVIRDYPEIKITNNTIRRNRARGMLLNCRGKTLVENNLFQAPGAALLFEGDSCYWFEQGGVRDCTIRGNTFDNCRFGVWGKAIIDVAAGIKEDFETSRYNRNILIENNTFNVFDDTPLLNIYCVDGLVWRNNKVNKTSEYPARDIKKPEPFIIRHSDNIKIDD